RLHELGDKTGRHRSSKPVLERGVLRLPLRLVALGDRLRALVEARVDVIEHEPEVLGLLCRWHLRDGREHHLRGFLAEGLVGGGYAALGGGGCVRHDYLRFFLRRRYAIPAAAAIGTSGESGMPESAAVAGAPVGADAWRWIVIDRPPPGSFRSLTTCGRRFR